MRDCKCVCIYFDYLPFRSVPKRTLAMVLSYQIRCFLPLAERAKIYVKTSARASRSTLSRRCTHLRSNSTESERASGGSVHRQQQQRVQSLLSAAASARTSSERQLDLSTGIALRDRTRNASGGSSSERPKQWRAQAAAVRLQQSECVLPSSLCLALGARKWAAQRTSAQCNASDSSRCCVMERL